LLKNSPTVLPAHPSRRRICRQGHSGRDERRLVRGHRIEIRGFGSFSINHSAPRMGRNPRSGESVAIPEKRVPHFKPGKALREAVDQRTAELESRQALIGGDNVRTVPRRTSMPNNDTRLESARHWGRSMKHLIWLFKWMLKAAIFFTLFAFALNNQQDTTCTFSLAHSGVRHRYWWC
jgi:hypothetical protein